MGVYTTPAAVRTAAGVLEAALSDPDAERLIAFAEDRIDSLLAGRAVDPTTGRKVVEVDVEAWQWTKLGTATARLAARFYATPDLIDDVRFRRVSGPEFTLDGPVGDALGPNVTGPLRDSALMLRPSTSVRVRRLDDVRGARRSTQGLVGE